MQQNCEQHGKPDLKQPGSKVRQALAVGPTFPPLHSRNDARNLHQQGKAVHHAAGAVARDSWRPCRYLGHLLHRVTRRKGDQAGNS